MVDDKRKPEFDDFDARLERVRERAGSTVDEPAESGKKAPNTTQAGLHIGIELVAGIIGGALIGYGLDAWLDMKPLWLIVFLVLGSAAGMLNAYRYISRMDRDTGDTAEG